MSEHKLKPLSDALKKLDEWVSLTKVQPLENDWVDVRFGINALERENDQLRAELAAAKAERAQMLAAFTKIYELRFTEQAAEPLDDAIEIAEAAIMNANDKDKGDAPP